MSDELDWERYGLWLAQNRAINNRALLNSYNIAWDDTLNSDDKVNAIRRVLLDWDEQIKENGVPLASPEGGAE